MQDDDDQQDVQVQPEADKRPAGNPKETPVKWPPKDTGEYTKKGVNPPGEER